MSITGAPPTIGRDTAEGPAQHRIGTGIAVLVGIVAVGLTLATGELIADVAAWLGLADPSASPFGALGGAFIAITPEWLKDIGIGLFGQSDKAALAVSMIVTFVVVGALIGLLGRINVHAAVAAGVVLLLVTGIAVLSRPDSGVVDLAPTALGGIVGLGFLLHALRPDPGGEGGLAMAPDRRRLFRVTGFAALAGIVAGGLSRVVPGVADVQANRAGVTLPPVASAPGSPADGAGVAAAVGGAAATAAPSPPPVTAVPVTAMPALPADVNPAVPGLTPYATPNGNFYRVDTAFTLPRVTTDAWRLKIHGLVDAPLQITWADLLAMPQVQAWVTLTCVSNEVGGDLAGNAAWQGVRIADLLARARPQAGADCVYSTSADGFTVTTPLDTLTDGRDALLAIGMNGAPLPIEHGFPVRMVVPGLYGYVSATKWVVDMEVTRFADATAYWTERGWAARGPIKTASRIDTPGDEVTVNSGVVAVAGVAWAQHRGISAVQVQVDDTPWQSATLAGAASKDTWRQWVYRWDTTGVAKGRHTLRCRAIDGTGAVQIAAPADPAPDGATGYHQVTVLTA